MKLYMFSSYYTLMDQLQGHLKVKGQNPRKKTTKLFFLEKRDAKAMAMH